MASVRAGGPVSAPCMTGVAVIILSADGTEAILGKTRCAREVVLDWFQDPAHRQPERFASLWSDFIVPRVRGCACSCQDLESTYSDMGFRFPWARRDPPGDGRALGRELLLEAEVRLALEDSRDDLLVPCGGPEILIDLRAQRPEGVSSAGSGIQAPQVGQ